MKIYPDCFACFFRQAVIAFDQAGVEETDRIGILQKIAGIVSGAELTGTPAHLTTRIHRLIREETGEDPFARIKSEYNRKALALYPGLKKKVAESIDPLFTASRLAIAGNIIDFGIFTDVDMEGTIRLALEERIRVDDYTFFRENVKNAERILYLLDNAGEIVFDRLLIEELKRRGKEVTAVVKGFPIINDATIIDASEIGLENVCRVIGNGSDAVGTILPWCGEQFNKEFKNAELIISKGQGNFETLMGRSGNIFFLFQSKCKVVSDHLGLEMKSMILSYENRFSPA